MTAFAEQSMTDQKPKEQAPPPASQVAADEPDPSVKPPALVWMYKSYKSEKTVRDGTAETSEDGKK